MAQDVGIRALVEPVLNDRDVQRETDNLAQKVDQATDAQVNLEGADGVDDIADGGGGPVEEEGGGLGAVAGGGLTRVALSGAIGAGLLAGMASLAGDFAPRFNKTMDLIWQGLGMIAASFLEPIANVLSGPAKAFFNIGKTALEDGLGAAAGEATEGAGEAVLGAIGADEIIESTPAEQIIGSASLLALIGGTIGATSFITGLIGGGSLGATGFLSALGIGGGTIAGSAIIGAAVTAGSIITAVAATAIIGSVALEKLLKTPEPVPETGEGLEVDRSLGAGIDRQQFGSVTAVPGTPPEGAFPGGEDFLNIGELNPDRDSLPGSEGADLGEPARISPEFARATGGEGIQTSPSEQTATVTLESGEQIQVDQSNVEQKLDNIEAAIKNIDTSTTISEQDLARSNNSAEETFDLRRNRDNNP